MTILSPLFGDWPILTPIIKNVTQSFCFIYKQVANGRGYTEFMKRFDKIFLHKILKLTTECASIISIDFKIYLVVFCFIRAHLGPMCCTGLLQHSNDPENKAKPKASLLLSQTPGAGFPKTVWMETMKASRPIAVVYGVFVVCWGPFAILLLVSLIKPVTYEVHMWVTWVAHLHSAVNFPGDL